MLVTWVPLSQVSRDQSYFAYSYKLQEVFHKSRHSRKSWSTNEGVLEKPELQSSCSASIKLVAWYPRLILAFRLPLY